VASVLAYHSCSIDIALIDTEGRRAIDVFYIKEDGRKLSDASEQCVRDALVEELTID
jgi:UTP:GlnB (protein PII) uridylyltransferase